MNLNPSQFSFQSPSFTMTATSADTILPVDQSASAVTITSIDQTGGLLSHVPGGDVYAEVPPGGSVTISNSGDLFLRSSIPSRFMIQPLASQVQSKPLICANRGWQSTGANAGSADTFALYQAQYEMLFDGYDIRLVYHNWVYDVNNQGYAGFQELANVTSPITITAGFGYQRGGTTVYHRVTFYGQKSVVLSPGAYVLSDPIGLHLASKSPFQVNTLLQASGANQKWPTGGYGWSSMAYNGGNEFYMSGTALSGTDYTINPMTSTVQGSDFAPYKPLAIIATPSKTGARAFALIGDSIAAGFSYRNGNAQAYPNDNGDNQVAPGIFQYWCAENGFPFLNIASPGAQASTELLATGCRFPLLSYVTDALISLGTNELSHYGTYFSSAGYAAMLPSIQADYVKFASELKSRGIKLHGVTIPPRAAPGNGDLYTNPPSQIPSETGTNDPRTDFVASHQAFNDWIRSKPSPLDSVIDLNRSLAATGYNDTVYGNGGIGFGGHTFTIGTSGTATQFSVISTDASAYVPTNGSLSNYVVIWTKLGGSTTINPSDNRHFITQVYGSGSITLNSATSLTPVAGDTFQLFEVWTCDGTHPLGLTQQQSDRMGLANLL